MILLIIAYLVFFLLGFSLNWISNPYDESRMLQLYLTLIVGWVAIFQFKKTIISKQFLISVLVIFFIVFTQIIYFQNIFAIYDLTMWMSIFVLFMSLKRQNFNHKHAENLLGLLVVVSIIPCLFIILSIINFLEYGIFYDWQMNSGSIRIYDSVIVPIFWIALYLYEKNKYIKNLYPLICFFIALGLFIDGARSALISLLLPLVLLFFLDRNYKKVILKTFLYFFVAFITYQGVFYYYNLIHEQEKSLSIARFSSSRRSDIWLYMFEQWKQNPFWGVGGGHLAQVEYPYGHHMHNVYMRLIFEWGFVGFVVLIWILSKIYHLLKSNVNIVLKMGVIAILIDSMFSCNFIYPASQVACVLFFALAFSQLSPKISQNGFNPLLNTKILYIGAYLFFVGLVLAYLKQDMQCSGCASHEGRAAPFFWEHGASTNLDKRDE